MTEAGTIKDVAQDASTSRPMGWAARVGLAARGVVYLIMGWLAVLVALGHLPDAARARLAEHGGVLAAALQEEKA